MAIQWTQAYGAYQLPFLGAANRVLQGQAQRCPKCDGALRSYFHAFQPTGLGSLWVWCGSCGLYATLPRVKPSGGWRDPFAQLPRGEFAAMETSREDVFLARLERLWSEGALR